MRAGALLLALALTGCSASLGGDGAVRRGVAALEAGDARTARVEFLNAIKAAPADPALRILQARAYLALGDGIAAEAEIDRAAGLHVRAAITAPLKAHALLLQDRPRDALDALGSAGGGYAERIRGRALAALGDAAGAGAAFDKAVALGARDADLLLDAARFRRSIGDLGGALAAADAAVAAGPRKPEAITFRGELTRTQYGLRAALPWFDRALEMDPKNVTAHLERAITLGDMGASRAMLAETRKVLALSPHNAMAYYLQAVLAARVGDFRLARSLYAMTQGRLDDQPAVLLLASAIDYSVGDPRGAVARLTHLLELQPDNDKARRLLGAAQWKVGNTAAVATTLRPIAERPDADSYTLSLMGKALARLGNMSGASLYLARAADPSGRTLTATIAQPADDVLLSSLRGEAAASPKDADEQVRLIRALLTRGLAPEALARARALAAANRGAPDPYLLVGDALGIGGDFDGAADQYRQAANLAFTEPVAMRLIAALQRSGQDEAAGDVLGLFLRQNPVNVPAQLLAASRAMAAHDWTQAADAYERLRRQVGDGDAVMLNNLAWAYAEQGQLDRALPLARRAWQLDRSIAATAETLGWILVKRGDKAHGLALLEQASRGAPSNVDIQRRLAAAKRG